MDQPNPSLLGSERVVQPGQKRLQVEGLWHRFGGNGAPWVLQGIDLQLQERELVGLLGPSGCGKTSLLRLIAGFDQPCRGQILLDGQEVSGPTRLRPPERRNIGMVFQDDALFPHLSVWDNACFGLGMGQDPSRAHWLLELVGLGGLEKRYPHELSGGQRQRLALARALAPTPSLVLLDEPFSNLDVEVRLHLRSELPGVLACCGATGLMVTHDPEEALAICDRVAVLNGGHLEQCAPPQQLVKAPTTGFVASFVLQANLLPAQRMDEQTVSTPLGMLRCPSGATAVDPNTPLQVLLRPEQLKLQADVKGPGSVVCREFLGRVWLYRIQLNQLTLKLRRPLNNALTLHQRCVVSIDPAAELLLYPQRLPLIPV
ncbi:Ferric iron ABC transporter, ATP-binding protein [Candidatus Synechococcus spongiarum]|uniref:ABC-type quaternary amine transporter n=2 Tax=Candidatus Synechococcus spongiarum TaxID=431041 RepID=A0A161KBJ3_9SYNE|nr:Ferric iron ABC transporter, ATP-binding protein [Candidatus Synechococcus spongiarum]